MNWKNSWSFKAHEEQYKHLSKEQTLSTRYLETRKVTLVGAVVNLLLSTAQLLGGFFTHSQGLIADGLHTLSDLASDFVVLLAARHAGRGADKKHPYGHGRIETLATSILGAILITVAGGIVVDTVGRFFSPDRLFHPSKFALIFALLAVVSKESLYHYTKRAGNRINSNLLIANAWHHRSDAISSMLVIAGILGSLYGFVKADAFAAIAVALMIGRMGFKLLWKSAQELIDASLDDETVDEINIAAQSVDGVIGLHQLRSRQSGGDAFVDVHVQVSPRISVSEGHHISDAVRHAISNALPQVADVTVHTDAEDDYVAPDCTDLPTRSELLQQIKNKLTDHPDIAGDHNIRFHYLDGKIEAELYLPMPDPGNSKNDQDITKTEQNIKEKIINETDISTVKIYFTTK